MNNKKTIILASQSLRRQEILEKCGYPFICEPANIDETIVENNPIYDEIRGLAYRKAMHIFAMHKDAIVIGADTVVRINGMVLGKPKDSNDAKRMLQMLQGKTHEVITGYALIMDGYEYNSFDVAYVTFCKMNDSEINKYIATDEGKDKAGSYGIQGFGGRYIEKIEGDYYTVMGLPLRKIYPLLEKVMD